MATVQILVVEDDTRMGEVARDTLEAHGYAVPAVATNGEEAVEKARELQPDAVLMDVRLKGGIDGIEAAERIREQMDVAVVYITGYPEGDSLRRAKMTEPYGYLVKPFEPADLCAAVDVALYKHEMDRRVRESEERYRAVFEQAADSIILVDPETGDLVEFNDKAYQNLGYTRAEFEKLRISDFEATENQEEVLGHVERIVRDGSDTFVTQHRTKQGEIRDVLVNSRVISVGGRQFVQGIWTDITRLMRMEKELERHRHELEVLVEERTTELRATQEELVRQARLAVVGQLVATVNHEMRNPLTTIRMSVYALRNLLSETHPDADPILARAERSVARCQKIIESLLDYTREHPLELRRTVIDEWVGAVLDEQSISPGITVVRELACGATVNIDPERMRRCIVNVIDNACEAMDWDAPGEQGKAGREARQLTVATRVDEERLRIEVRDTGSGIASEAQDKVLQPLFTTKSFGVGLGLPAVLDIMRQHGGGVEVESEPGRGTTVTLWLPSDATTTGDTAEERECS